MPGPPKDAPPPRDPKQIIDDHARQIDRLREDLVRSENERHRLRRENERLREELEMARRRANRQAAPCSRGLPKEHPERPGRRAGAAYGRKAHRPRPRQIDYTHEASLPGQCPDCGGPVRQRRVVSQYQEDLPVQRPVVHEFRVAVGQWSALSPSRAGPASAANLRCARCRRRAPRPAGGRARGDPE